MPNDRLRALDRLLEKNERRCSRESLPIPGLRVPECNFPSVCEAEDGEDPLARNSSLLASVLIGGVTICLAAF